MSRTQPSSFHEQPQGRISDVIDHMNVDDLCNQPSPQELAAASELRVQQIIEDLKRRTIEEIEHWSMDSLFDPELRLLKLPDHYVVFADTSNATLDEDLVSPSISLLPSTSLSSPVKSNSTAATTSESNIRFISRPARHQATSSTSQDQSLRKSSIHHERAGEFTSSNAYMKLGTTCSSTFNTKQRIDNTHGPIRIMVHEIACCHHETSPAQHQPPRLTPQEGKMVISASSYHPAQRPGILGATSRRTALPLSPSAQLAIDPANLVEVMLDTKPDTPTEGDHSASLIGESFARSLPQSVYSNAPSYPSATIKRKLLPVDSPLLLPLGQHPAFKNHQSKALGL